MRSGRRRRRSSSSRRTRSPSSPRRRREGRIEEFSRLGWDPAIVPDPQDPETFERSRLDWSELGEGRHARILDVYRQLARLRRTLPQLTDPSFERTRCTADEDTRLFTMHRGDVVVVVNFGTEPVTTSVDDGPEPCCSRPSRASTWPGTSLTLPAHAGALLAPPRTLQPDGSAPLRPRQRPDRRVLPVPPRTQQGEQRERRVQHVVVERRRRQTHARRQVVGVDHDLHQPDHQEVVGGQRAVLPRHVRRVARRRDGAGQVGRAPAPGSPPSAPADPRPSR